MAPRAATEEDLHQRLALNVRRLREAAGLTLEQAAERSGMYWRHWQKVEAGEVNATLRTLARLGLALEVDPGELIGASKRADRK
jgi:transcriptional regulator with XRE-family HTH domain